MILLQFSSGLGNQMFQYCFFKYLQEKYGEETVKPDLTWFDWHSAHQGYELEKVFGIRLEGAKRSEVLKASGRIPQDFPGAYYVNRFLRLFTEKKREPFILDEIERDHRLDEDKDWYLTGFYISEEYYRDRLDQIQGYFVFPDEKKTGLSDIAGKIRERTSVSVHVRRGDYLSSLYEDKFVSLGMDFYRRAADVILSAYPDARFFVFSDDKDFISTAFDWLPEKTPVTLNSGKKSYIDMLLMSKAQCLITANSTFSEWAGLLNKRQDSMILYPREYLKEKDSS